MDAVRVDVSRGGACALAGDSAWFGDGPHEADTRRAQKAEDRLHAALDASHEASGALSNKHDEVRVKTLDLKSSQNDLADARASLTGLRAEERRLVEEAEIAAQVTERLGHQGLLTSADVKAAEVEAGLKTQALQTIEANKRQLEADIAATTTRVSERERRASEAQLQLSSAEARVAQAATEVEQSAAIVEALTAAATATAATPDEASDLELRKGALTGLLCQKYDAARPAGEPSMLEAVKTKEPFRVCDADNCYFVTPDATLEGEVCVCPAAVLTISGGCAAAGCKVSDIRVDVSELMACKLDMS